MAISLRALSKHFNQPTAEVDRMTFLRHKEPKKDPIWQQSPFHQNQGMADVDTFDHMTRKPEMVKRAYAHSEP